MGKCAVCKKESGVLVSSEGILVSGLPVCSDCHEKVIERAKRVLGGDYKDCPDIVEVDVTRYIDNDDYRYNAVQGLFLFYENEDNLLLLIDGKLVWFAKIYLRRFNAGVDKGEI